MPDEDRALRETKGVPRHSKCSLNAIFEQIIFFAENKNVEKGRCVCGVYSSGDT